MFSFAAVLLCAVPAAAQGDPELQKCVKTSGGTGKKCLKSALKNLGLVLTEETTLITGVLDKTTDKLGKVAREKGACNAERTEDLGYTSKDDLRFRIREACDAFALEINGLVYADGAPVAANDDEEKCHVTIYRTAAKLADTNIKWHGQKCIVDQYGGTCDRAKRDEQVAKSFAKSVAKIEKTCGANFDTLITADGATLADRIGTFLQVVETRGRHFAQHVYPPGYLGETTSFGPFPVGVKTLALEDASRLNVAGDGPRPMLTEVYYPTTDAAIVGELRDIVELFDIEVVETPAYRDVAIAAGEFPLVVFSHGNNGLRIQSFFFAAHLASHGYIVATPDHHGNTFLDPVFALDPTPEVNRPLDMSFLIDEMLAADASVGDFFEGSVDEDRIGASGHSFGGFTSLLLAGGDAGFGTFTDPRVKAILPQAPAAPFSQAFFESITVPTLIVGGSLDETTPFPTNQQTPYDQMLSGPLVLGLAELDNAGHFSFSDFCEVPEDILGFIGGAAEACEPRHLPWRYAQNITKYLALNFFEGILRGDTDALDRLNQALVDDFDDVRYESK